MKSDLRYRQVHLDFHTSEHIPAVGAHFDPQQFVHALKLGNVNSVTVFARGHHGWCYYPSKIGKPHPNLARPDLLGDMVAACRAADINVPIYHTVQWDERMAREHPEWRVMSATNRASAGRAEDRSAMNQLTPAWHPLCLNNPELVRYLKDVTLETMELYRPDGIFMDILLSWECVCPKCLASMAASGLDPERADDRRVHDRMVIMSYYRELSEAVWAKDPDMRIFHNSGHIYKGERDRYRFFSHLEVESLPTGGWGYDHFPVSARYINTLGMEYLGMTGKFHTTWGEFGGYKRPVALEYECAAMVALGARCSVGDQLHPSGRMDEATYETIGPAYRRVERLEPYALGAKPVSDIAILSSAAHRAWREPAADTRRCEPDDGASRMLLELHEMFDVIDLDADFGAYRILVLPDTITMDDTLEKRIGAFVASGGTLIASGDSGLSLDAQRMVLPIDVMYGGRKSEYAPDYVEAVEGLDPDLPRSPFVVYERARAVKAGRGASVLAQTRVPYFNRSWDRFSSHQHTPYRMERNDAYDAAVTQGGVVYFSHPIFTAYYRSGQPLLKYLFRGALDRIAPGRSLRIGLPSSGRISYMEQRDRGRRLLHLLFAQTQSRGSGMPLETGEVRRVEIIEDAVPLFAVPCELALASRPKRVFSAYSGSEIPSSFERGVLRFTVDRVYLHELVVIEQ